MSANRFATMVHTSTNKITLILIYALLEWTLIFLLLLNSLFSYFIIKFAQYFGLNPPCLWCSRVDHILENGKSNNFHKELLCKVHVAEISQLGLCSIHQKLAVSQNMCQDCLSSRPESHGLLKNFEVRTDGVAEVKCSCCGESLDCSKYSEYSLLKPSWDDIEFSDKNYLIREIEGDDDLEEEEKLDVTRPVLVTDQGQEQCFSESKNQKLVDSDVEDCFVARENEKTEERFLSQAPPELQEMEKNGEREFFLEEFEGRVLKDQSVQVSIGEDAFNGQHLEFFLDNSGHRLVPIELIDSPIKKDHGMCRSTDGSQYNGDNFGAHLEFEENVKGEDELDGEMESEAAFSPRRDEEESKLGVFESMEMEEDDKTLVFNGREFPSLKELLEQIAITQAAHQFEANAATQQEDNHSALEDVPEVAANETDAEVSIGTEIPDVDATDDVHPQDEFECSVENPSTSSSNLILDDDYSAEVAEEQTVEFRSLSVELNEQEAMNNPSIFPSLNSIEEDKVPDTDTPTSIDGTLNISKRQFFLEKKDSGTEDSLDGSLISELECGDGIVTVERLKSVLRAEHKNLQALYAELEEERSASAVAANQTMAMINRLQEEKAQMQMEALQYQRMMEEQSEYDQEALQLLNELMVKREKEKQELENELEIYRRKVVEYETKEKLRILRKSKDGSNRSAFSSASCSNAEDSDALSIDLNQEAKEEDGFSSREEFCNGHSPIDAILNLEESLTDFEEERFSILEQLKILEVKLMNLDEEEQKKSEDVSPLQQFPEENGNHKLENGHANGEENGHANGCSDEINGKHHQERRTIGAKGKNLLPLFDAIDEENGDLELDKITNGLNSNGVHGLDMRNLELDNKKLDVEEQVDHLYERLQALEADREFLKHCMSSLRKGDKGIHLLQEILQHLRDLRNVELRVRNFDDYVAV